MARDAVHNRFKEAGDLAKQLQEFDKAIKNVFDHYGSGQTMESQLRDVTGFCIFDSGFQESDNDKKRLFCSPMSPEGESESTSAPVLWSRIHQPVVQILQKNILSYSGFGVLWAFIKSEEEKPYRHFAFDADLKNYGDKIETWSLYNFNKAVPLSWLVRSMDSPKPVLLQLNRCDEHPVCKDEIKDHTDYPIATISFSGINRFSGVDGDELYSFFNNKYSRNQTLDLKAIKYKPADDDPCFCGWPGNLEDDLQNIYHQENRKNGIDDVANQVKKGLAWTLFYFAYSSFLSLKKDHNEAIKKFSQNLENRKFFSLLITPAISISDPTMGFMLPLWYSTDKELQESIKNTMFISRALGLALERHTPIVEHTGIEASELSSKTLAHELKRVPTNLSNFVLGPEDTKREKKKFFTVEYLSQESEEVYGKIQLNHNLSKKLKDNIGLCFYPKGIKNIAALLELWCQADTITDLDNFLETETEDIDFETFLKKIWNACLSLIALESDPEFIYYLHDPVINKVKLEEEFDRLNNIGVIAKKSGVNIALDKNLELNCFKGRDILCLGRSLLSILKDYSLYIKHPHTKVNVSIIKVVERVREGKKQMDFNLIIEAMDGGKTEEDFEKFEYIQKGVPSKEAALHSNFHTPRLVNTILSDEKTGIDGKATRLSNDSPVKWDINFSLRYK